MRKSLSSLWLRSVRQLGKLGKVQARQGRKLLKTLLPVTPRPTAKGRNHTPSQQALIDPLSGVASVPPVIERAIRRTTRPAGQWSKAYFHPPAESLPAGAIAKRMGYWLYLPSRHVWDAYGDTHEPMPLVVMLHGCKQTATDIATATRLNALADRKGFAVLYPQQSAAADAHRCWHWYQRDTQQGGGDVALIASLIDRVRQQHGLDASRIYLAGLSAGAALANLIALHHPALIAAVGLHSAPVFGTTDSPISAYRAMQHGAMLLNTEAAREFTRAAPQFPGMPTIVIHGDGDSVVRRINARQLVEQMHIVNAPWISSAHPVARHHAGRAGGRSPRHGYRSLTYYAGRKPYLVQCDIESLGHAWSGGDGSVDYSTPAGPNATLMMWNFFALHRRLPAASPPQAGAGAPVEMPAVSPVTATEATA